MVVSALVLTPVMVGGGRRKKKKGEGSVRDWIAGVFDFGDLSKIMVGVEDLVFHGWFRSKQGGVKLWCGGGGFQKIGSVDGPWWRGEAIGQKEVTGEVGFSSGLRTNDGGTERMVCGGFLDCISSAAELWLKEPGPLSIVSGSSSDLSKYQNKV
ncbi:hypothetical protein HAX54_024246 [Datura stramonium]|uniref:Uncharacterized protein n=1 Tax=Datura stramonium TaxID=4076 RepID=A0ABS8UXQ9_DATST|nr:hypothetical protein [Datura stramonium]